MAKIEVKGEVKAVTQKEVTSGGHQKQTLVLNEVNTTKDGATYENDMAFDFWNDKIEKISNVGVGDVVNVVGSVSSREWEGKYYSNVNGFYVEKIGTKNKQQGQLPPESSEDINDFPF